MKAYRGIAMSDGLNRKNHLISLNAIFSAYEAGWQHGTPTGVNHDHTKLVGWNYINGIYLEPGKAYVLNKMYVAENQEEHRQLWAHNIAYLNKVRYIEKQDEYQVLKGLLGEKLSEQAEPASINAVAYYDKGIVLKVYPEISEKIDEGLIDLCLLETVIPGVYKRGNYLLFAHSFFRRSFTRLNSLNDSFLERIEKLRGTGQRVKIALDMDVIGLSNTARKEFEYQYWWGPKFDDDLSKISNGVTKHENDHYDKLFSSIRTTEFGWHIQDGKKTFECEEITDIPNIEEEGQTFYGCRYVHSMLNPDTDLPTHLDGAVRAYTDEKMITRLDLNLDKAARDTWYTKLWRVDNDISVGLWKELITHYFRDNMLVGEYLGGKDEKFDRIVLEDHAKDTVIPLEKYVPSNMNSTDGIRFTIQYSDKKEINSNYDVYIRPDEVYILKDKNWIRGFETETLNILKMLRNQGLNVRFPFSTRIAHEDLIFNFPTFYCKNIKVASDTHMAIRQLCDAWNKKQDDRLISYSLCLNYKDKNILFSFAGHVSCFSEMFRKIGTELPSETRVKTWVLNLYDFMSRSPVADATPKVFELTGEDGKLRYRRQLVPDKYLNLKVEDHSVITTFTVKKEIAEELIENKIGIAPIIKIGSSKCSKCGKEFFNCTCVKYVDDCSEKIKEMRYLGAAWTNRHA